MMKFNNLSSLLLLGAIFYSVDLSAFPFMIKHGYTQCRTCHHSPTGGGILTNYGRALSKEILSGSAVESLSEASFAYGLLKLPKNLDAIAEVKTLNLLRVPSTYQSSLQFILMQADLELGYQISDFTVVASGGYQDPPLKIKPQWTDSLIARRFYALYKPSRLDEKLSIRAGKFFPQIGVNTPEHAIATRRGLGWDERQESLNLEAQYFMDPFQLQLTGTLYKEIGVSFGPAYSFSDTGKLGFNFFSGYRDGVWNRQLYTLWVLWGLSPKWHLTSEFDFQYYQDYYLPDGLAAGTVITPRRLDKSGLFYFQKMDFEPWQGVHFNAVHDFSKSDFLDSENVTYSVGAGTQVFPLPHVELALSWLRTFSRTVLNKSDTDWWYLMLHYYL